MAIINKYIMWVENIDNEREVVCAAGHEKLGDKDSFEKFYMEFSFEWLEIMLAENYNEFMQIGRMFYYTHSIEPGCEINRVELTNFPPLTEEQIKEAEKRAEYWFENLTGE